MHSPILTEPPTKQQQNHERKSYATFSFASATGAMCNSTSRRRRQSSMRYHHLHNRLRALAPQPMQKVCKQELPRWFLKKTVKNNSVPQTCLTATSR